MNLADYSQIGNPSKFFEIVKEERGIKSASIYLAVIFIIKAIIGSFFLSILISLSAWPAISILDFAEKFFIISISAFLGNFIIFSIFVLVLHLFLKFLLKGQGDLSSTYRVAAYSSIPYYVITLIGSFWFTEVLRGLLFIYLLTIGLSIIHRTSKLKSFLGTIIPILILIILDALFAVMLINILYILKFGSLKTQDANEAQYLYDTAVSAKNFSLCEEIHPSYEQRDACMAKVAMVLKDISLCKKISGYPMRLGCFVSVVKDKKNISLCDEISNEMEKEQCKCIVGST